MPGPVVGPGGDTPSGPDDDQSAISGGVVPAPILVSKSMEGTTAAFAWSNPDPQDGDSYLWKRTDGSQEGRSTIPTTEPSATITGVGAGDTVCIEVDIRRKNGAISANPLEECVP
jgi:hypothetical protein